jgi:hypothetical protein
MALAPLAGQINVAFIYGSVATFKQRSGSDVDLMVVDDVSFGDVVSALRAARELLHREINPTVYSPAEFRSKLKAPRQPTVRRGCWPSWRKWRKQSSPVKKADHPYPHLYPP